MSSLRHCRHSGMVLRGLFKLLQEEEKLTVTLVVSWHSHEGHALSEQAHLLCTRRRMSVKSTALPTVQTATSVSCQYQHNMLL